MVKRKLRIPKPYPNANLHQFGRARVVTSQSPGMSTLSTLGRTIPETKPSFTPSVCSPATDAGPSLFQGIQSPEGMLNQCLDTASGLTPICNNSACPEPTTLDQFSCPASVFNETHFQLENSSVPCLQPWSFAMDASQSLPVSEPQSPPKVPNFTPPRRRPMEDKEVVRMVLEGSNSERIPCLVRYRATLAESRVNKSWVDRERRPLQSAHAPPREGMSGYYKIIVVGGEMFDGSVRERFNIQDAKLDDSEIHIDMGYRMASRLGLAPRRQKRSNRVKAPVQQDLSWTYFTGAPAYALDRFENLLDNQIFPVQLYPSASLTFGNTTNGPSHTPTPMRSPNPGFHDAFQDAAFIQPPTEADVNGSTPQPNCFSSEFPNPF
ncbi:hypothetical protein B0T10DRAFT_471476 [Thelonectria olida]|uniref:Uncharacterized protein n=1 Tax=Thelonectria olida TaxID=1576542 RepID=A0A9P8WJE4_9HYPO|nr:hypothetical protein B0T10DRAFT_471476 [Thelonectria olida]